MKVKIESVFEAAAGKVWNELKKTSSLMRVCKPILVFRPMDSVIIPDTWKISSMDLKLYLFGFIPLGKHTIRIETIDDDNMEIHSKEKGKIAKTWNHFIKVENIDSNRSKYLDEVEIKSGVFTIFVYLFANIFYRHRQRKWRKILKTLR